MTLVAVSTILLAAYGIHLAASKADTQPAHTRLISIGTAVVYSPRPDAPCPGSRRAIRYYRAAYTEHRQTMGQPGAPKLVDQGCNTARTMAAKWRGLARQARVAAERWWHYHYAWWDWMPRGWQNVGACETGYGKRPGRFDWNSGTHQGFAGFYRGSWDAFVSSADPKAGPYPSEAYEATPRQQYEVALAIWRRYGLSGWGCRGAYYR